MIEGFVGIITFVQYDDNIRHYGDVNNISIFRLILLAMMLFE